MKCSCGGKLVASGIVKPMHPPIVHHVCQSCLVDVWLKGSGDEAEWLRGKPPLSLEPN